MKIADITFGGSTYPILRQGGEDPDEQVPGCASPTPLQRRATARLSNDLVHPARHHPEPFDEGLGR
jgi:hypothetical protein